MKVSNKILKSKIARTIPRIKYASDSYQKMVDFRFKNKLDDKPVDLDIKIKKITIYFLYTFENYSYIHNALESFFDAQNFFERFEELKNSEKNLSHRGWHHIGNIVPKKQNSFTIFNNSISMKSLPAHTKYISCNIHKILPSTSVLSCEFYLDDGFRADLYRNFYSPNDVVLKTDILFKQLSIKSIQSGDKFNSLLNEKIKRLESWILDIFSIKSKFILSTNSLTTTTLKNLSNTKSRSEIMQRNSLFLSSQAFYHGPNCYSNHDSYYSLDKLDDIRLFCFKNDEELESEKYTYFTTSILLLIILNTYKEKLENLRKSCLNWNNTIKIEELKTKTLACNLIDFQISRLFQEIHTSNLDNFLAIRVEAENLETESFYKGKYADLLKNQIASYSKLLPENSLLLKNLIDSKFEAMTVEVNFDLQQEMKRLSKVAIVVAMVSILITALNSNWTEVKKNAEATREWVQGK